MAKQITAPPDSISVRSAIPSTNSPIVMRFIKPGLFRVIQKKLIKGGLSGYEADIKRFEAKYDIDPVSGLPRAETIQPESRSWFFGTPVIDELIISHPDYLDENGNRRLAGGIIMQNIILTVNQPKIIERTRVPGHRGRIKQFISEDDFEIQAIGKIIAPPKDYYNPYSSENGLLNPRGEFKQGERPTEELTQLINVLRAQVEVDVVSPFLNLFDIDKCVIGPYSFPQEEGKLDNQFLKFTMWSDEDFDVTTGAEL